jgi:hypothetical protein
MNLFHHKQGQSGDVTAGELGHSQYGTPLSQIIHADLNVDWQKWIIIPTNWGPGFRCEDPQDWATDAAPGIWGAWVERTPGAEHPSQDVIDRTALELKAYGEKYGGFDPSRPFEIVTYLYLPDPRQFAIAVRVWVDDRPDLPPEQAAGAQDPDAIDTPLVEKFHTPALGTGIKVTRHGTLDQPRDDIPDGTGVYLAVRYAFAVPGRQAVVTVAASNADLARMAAAGPDLDEFVRTIALTLADGTPVTTGTAADRHPGPDG